MAGTSSLSCLAGIPFVICDIKFCRTAFLTCVDCAGEVGFSGREKRSVSEELFFFDRGSSGLPVPEYAE